MARQPRFTPKKTDKGWMVNIPGRYTASGKRERQFFTSRSKAADAVTVIREKQESFGPNANIISPALAEQANAAAELLKPYGITIFEAAARIAEMERKSSQSMPIEQAFEQFFATKEGLSKSQVTAYRLIGVGLKSDFGGCLICEVSGAQLQKHLSKGGSGAGGYNQKVRLLKSLWRWCAKPPREWCETKAVDHLEPRESVSKGVAVLTAVEAETLLRTAQKHYPEMVPSLAVALFTGARKEEIQRIEASEVSSEGIIIPAAKSKNKRRRFIQMSEPLAAWLKAYPISDYVVPPNYQRKEKAVRRLAGWRVFSDTMKDDEGNYIFPSPDLPEWPSNALRHTAATVALAIGKPIETLVFEHGHSGGLTTLQRHYIGVMPKAEALNIWALRP